VQTGIGRKIEYRFRMPNGSLREIESLGSAIRDSEGRVARVVVLSHDVTERKRMEEEVRQLAFYDALTKLPNRRLLNDRLSQTMAASARSNCYGALMFLDLDNFKSLNDTHGHEVGDLLLIEAADRLKSCVREMDTVARFGGDEFVVMISELGAEITQSIAQVGRIAEKIRVTLSEPYLLTIKHEGRTDKTIKHRCTASIGVALFIDHQAGQEDILKWADAAMYQAKEAGRNSIRFFNPEA
jgi:diguanylate cyclase (GGDEF)-like protein